MISLSERGTTGFYVLLEFMVCGDSFSVNVTHLSRWSVSVSPLKMNANTVVFSYMTVVV